MKPTFRMLVLRSLLHLIRRRNRDITETVESAAEEAILEDLIEKAIEEEEEDA